DYTNTLATAPDIAPCTFFSAAAEIHFAGIRLGQIVRIHASIANTALEIIAVHAGVEIAVDDIVGIAVHDHLLVIVHSPRLLRRNKRRADIGKVSSHCLGSQNGSSGGNG